MIKVVGKDIVLAKSPRVAKTSFQKMKGLMCSKEMKGFDCLVIPFCNTVHTFFMNYPIDVVFVSRKNVIVKVIRNMRPWRHTLMYLRARDCLEFSGGTVPEDVDKGDEVIIDV